jgi:hypothetical protein
VTKDTIAASLRSRLAAVLQRQSGASWNGPLAIRWRADLNRDAVLLIGTVVGIAAASKALFNPIDATAYWEAGTSQKLYPASWSEVANGYLFYPPPVAQLSTLLQPLGWPLFVTLLMTLVFWSVWYCTRRWALPLLALGVPWYLNIGPPEPAVFLEYALLGNLQWVLAAVSIMALGRPPLWAVLLLTKVTTAVGWWWHVVRGEWRLAAVAALTSLTIIAVSFAAAPSLWFDFIRFVGGNFTLANPPIPLFPVPIGVRVVTALALVVWGARTNRSWTIPVATGWALPALYGVGFLPFWAAAAVAWHDGRLRTPART